MAGEEHTAKERPTSCSQIDGDGVGRQPKKILQFLPINLLYINVIFIILLEDLQMYITHR